jgi:hypothetical protein
MYTTYHLKEDELNEDFLKAVKKLFRNKKLTITVAEELDETEYLLSNPANKTHLVQSINQVNESKLVSFDSVEDIQKKLNQWTNFFF